MPVLPLAGFMSGAILSRIRRVDDKKKEHEPEMAAAAKSDYGKTIQARLRGRMYELKNATKESVGIRQCAYIAAKEIDQSIADEVLAELNNSFLHKGNYFNGDDWSWYLASGEFEDEFCRRIFGKYGTCYWDDLKEKLKF